MGTRAIYIFYGGERKSCSPDENDNITDDKSTNLKPITKTNEFHKALVLSGNQYIQKILGKVVIDSNSDSSSNDEHITAAAPKTKRVLYH